MGFFICFTQFFSYLYTMFFKKNNIIISDTKFNIIKKNVKLKFLPKEGEFIYFDDQKEYFVVHKIIHNFAKENNIWVTIIPIENNDLTNIY